MNISLNRIWKDAMGSETEQTNIVKASEIFWLSKYPSTNPSELGQFQELQRNSGNVADDRRTFRFEFSGEWRLNVEKRQDSRGCSRHFSHL